MILVHQMMKVASLSWHAAARPAADRTGSQLIHVHFLAPRNLARIAENLNETGELQTIANPFLLRQQARKGEAVRALLRDARGRGEVVRVIAGIRDPIARSLSAAQFVAEFFGNSALPPQVRRVGTDAAALALESWNALRDGGGRTDTFFRRLAFIVGVYRHWFEEEFVGVHGLALDNGRFPAREGAEMIAGDGIEALLYRVEDMQPDSPNHAALLRRASEFLGVEVREFPRVNSAAARRTYERYRDARTRLRISPTMLDFAYDVPIVKRFYSGEEIAAFKAKWS
jgi:hypothetical protein